MKHTKSILAALVAALSVGAASAASTAVTNAIYIAGSTAFSKAACPAVYNVATNNNFTLIASDSGKTGSGQDVSGCKAMLFRKSTVISGVTNVDIINMGLIGSEGGIQSAASGTTKSTLFIPNNTPATNGTFTFATTGEAHVADVTFSDVNQLTTSRFYKALAGDGTTYAALLDKGAFGLVDFAWAVSPNAAVATNGHSAFTNITAIQARKLFTAGNLPLSYFTGVNSDSNTGVYLIGRDIDSGTRGVALAEAGLSITNPVNQYSVDSNGVIALQTATTVNGIAEVAGNGGYNDSGLMATALTYAPTSGWDTNKYTNAVVIGYSGTSKVQNTVPATGKYAISFNGIAPALSNEATGAYSFWSFEHLYINATTKTSTAHKLSSVSGSYTPSTFGDAVISQLGTVIATDFWGKGYTHTNDVLVTRAQEGAVISIK